MNAEERFQHRLLDAVRQRHQPDVPLLRGISKELVILIFEGGGVGIPLGWRRYRGLPS